MKIKHDRLPTNTFVIFTVPLLVLSEARSLLSFQILNLLAPFSGRFQATRKAVMKENYIAIFIQNKGAFHYHCKIFANCFNQER